MKAISARSVCIRHVIPKAHADFSHAVDVDPGSRFYDPIRGGGALLDLGVYTRSFAQLLLGEPVELTGLLDIGRTGVDEQATVVLGYAGGATAVLTFSLRTNGPNQVAIAGTLGTIRMPGPLCAPPDTRSNMWGRRRPSWVTTRASANSCWPIGTQPGPCAASFVRPGVSGVGAGRPRSSPSRGTDTTTRPPRWSAAFEQERARVC